MIDRIDLRVLEEARYISEHSATVRDAAKLFGVSKSTVHKDLVERASAPEPGPLPGRRAACWTKTRPSATSGAEGPRCESSPYWKTWQKIICLLLSRHGRKRGFFENIPKMRVGLRLRFTPAGLSGGFI